VASIRITPARPSRRFARLCAVTVLFAAAGCGNKSLQKLDASGGSIGPIGGDGGGLGDGGVADGGGVADAGGAWERPPWDVPFAGRRSFVVTSNVFADSGGPSVTSHVFTLTLDAGQKRGILGGPGGGVYRSFAEEAGVLILGGTAQFGVPISAACGAHVEYDDLRLQIDASGGLTGSGLGNLSINDGTGFRGGPVTMVLTGVPDTEPPELHLSPGGDLADPWTPIWIVASEPLPLQQKWPMLRSATGDLVEFEPTIQEDFVSVLNKPRRMLRFDDSYIVAFSGITDLPGNELAPSSAVFTTRPLPPIVAGDGFESATDATVGGAPVLSGAAAPTIEGARSLYIAPAAVGGPLTQFAVRLSFLPGQKVVRFDYRIVNPGDAGGTYWLVATSTGLIETATLNPDIGAAVTASTIDGTQVLLGPTRTAAIPIPADARGEVVVARVASQAGAACGGPPAPPVPGILVDGLRAE